MRKNCRPYKKSCSSLLRRVAVVLCITATLLVLCKVWDMDKANQSLLAETAELTQQYQSLQNEIAELNKKKGGVQEHGRLSVKGELLCDQNGKPIVLRGLSSHGIAWYPEYTNYRSLQTLKDYGANVFRIAMYVAQNDGYIEEPELNKKLLFSAIENSLAADLYTIVDWHVLRDQNPKRHLDEAVTILGEVARRYGDEPGIIYEICNEPNGDTTYEDIVEYAKQVLPVIREYAPNAIILVGTPKYCTSLAEAIEHPLPYENVMYTYHYYAGSSDCKFAIEEISRGIEHGLPVFISEWGLDSHAENAQYWEETNHFLDFLEESHIGWVNWSLSNKNEGYSMIRNDVEKLYGWELDEFTDVGRLVLERLSNTEE